MSVFLLPPVGLVLLWMRPTSLVRKLLGTVGIAVLTIAHLFFVYGLRVELTGGARGVVFSFDSPQEHYAELERHRASQQATSPPSVPPPILEPTTAEAGSEAPTTEAPTLTPPAPFRYWIRFRGPGMDGIYNEMPIRTSWPEEGLSPLWKQPVGEGYASFTVADGHAFTIEQRRDEEMVVAYEVASGREVWTHHWPARFTETMGGDGPRATPTWDRGRVYALGATGELVVLDAKTGSYVWGRNILSDAGATNLQWGMAASPLVVGELLIVLPGGPEASVVAYDKQTGQRRWAAEGDVQAYITPLLVTLGGKPQLLVVSRDRAMGLTVDDGTQLWDYPWRVPFDTSAAQPVVLPDSRFCLSAANDHGAAVVEIRREGSGLAAHEVWRTRSMKNNFSSSLFHQGVIYGLDDGILAAVDAASGERLWKGGRYGHGQLILASGHLVVLSEKGELALVEATSEAHREKARFQAIEGKTWNHPALADGILLIRNARQMAAFQLAAR